MIQTLRNVVFTLKEPEIKEMTLDEPPPLQIKGENGTVKQATAQENNEAPIQTPTKSALPPSKI
jgi:hypothetical protein